MSYSDDLLSHAAEILSIRGEVQFRRSISASYYALFHRLTRDATAIIAPNVGVEVAHRIQRWFDHPEMRRVCGRFAKQVLDQPLSGVLGTSASQDLRTVATSFNLLQEARHSADYDLAYSVDFDKSFDFYIMAINATEAWSRIANSAEANIFILSLILWKNWDRERI